MKSKYVLLIGTFLLIFVNSATIRAGNNQVQIIDSNTRMIPNPVEIQTTTIGNEVLPMQQPLLIDGGSLSPLNVFHNPVWMNSMKSEDTFNPNDPSQIKTFQRLSQLNRDLDEELKRVNPDLSRGRAPTTYKFMQVNPEVNNNMNPYQRMNRELDEEFKKVNQGYNQGPGPVVGQYSKFMQVNSSNVGVNPYSNPMANSNNFAAYQNLGGNNNNNSNKEYENEIKNNNINNNNNNNNNNNQGFMGARSGAPYSKFMQVNTNNNSNSNNSNNSNSNSNNSNNSNSNSNNNSNINNSNNNSNINNSNNSNNSNNINNSNNNSNSNNINNSNNNSNNSNNNSINNTPIPSSPSSPNQNPNENPTPVQKINGFDSRFKQTTPDFTGSSDSNINSPNPLCIRREGMLKIRDVDQKDKDVVVTYAVLTKDRLSYFVNSKDESSIQGSIELGKIKESLKLINGFSTCFTIKTIDAVSDCSVCAESEDSAREWINAVTQNAVNCNTMSTLNHLNKRGLLK